MGGRSVDPRETRPEVIAEGVNLLRQQAEGRLDTLETQIEAVTDVANSRVLGRATTGSGAVEELTLSQVLDLIGSAAEGDILYRGASAWARLGAGTSGQFLQTQGAAAAPQWVAATLQLAVTAQGLTVAADKFPYATGASSWAMADLTSFARTILDDANAGAVRSTIGAAADSEVVHNTGNESVAGIKTFSQTCNFSSAISLGSFSATPGANDDGKDITTGVGFAMRSSRGSTAVRNHELFYNPNGLVGSIQTSGSATAYNTTSGRRVKDDILDPSDDDLTTRFSRCGPRDYVEKADPTRKRIIGFIAEELAEACPEAVTPPNPELGITEWQVDYGRVSAVLWGVVGVLNRRVADLTARLEALEGRQMGRPAR